MGEHAACKKMREQGERVHWELWIDLGGSRRSQLIRAQRISLMYIDNICSVRITFIVGFRSQAQFWQQLVESPHVSVIKKEERSTVLQKE